MQHTKATLAAMLLLLPAAPGLAGPAYLRYPDLNGDRLVFTAEGDLWLAAADGGLARRITSNPGNEYHPKFSPDGATIAFSGTYAGNTDVYVMAATGGEPRRLTWHPDPDEVLGFTPDGSRVLFRSRRDDAHGDWHLFTVSVAGGEGERLPLGWAARLSIEPETGRYAFNRTQWERSTWKRYRGGTSTTIWVGDRDRADFAQVTTFAGLNSFPMWHGGRIYFVSDEGGTANIWSMSPDGGDRRQHTRHAEWDARFPSMAPDGRIVYMLAGGIHLFDPATEADREIAVDVASDRALSRVRYPDPARDITWFDISPKGDRLAITTRGEVFSVAVKDGVTLPVTKGSGARESWASFGPKGERLVLVTDATGEEAIESIDAWGRGRATTVLPPGKSGWHFPPAMSPDGKRVAWADQTQTLYVAPAAGGSTTVVDRSRQAEIHEYAWSPDGRWLAYAKHLDTDFSSVFLYDTVAGKTHAVTGPSTNDTSPAWDPDGRYLYFASDRVIDPLLDWQDATYVLIRPTQLFMVLLRKDVRNPMAPLSGLPDSADTSAGNDDGDGKDGKDKGDRPSRPVAIDLDGLQERVVALPVAPGNYGALLASSKKVYYLSYPIQGMADEPDDFDMGDTPPRSTLMSFDLEDKKAVTYLDGVGGFAIARKADKLAVAKGRGELYVLDAGAPPGDKLAEGRVKLDGIVIELDPRAEWSQIYYEGWRHMRDFVWEPDLGGLDWVAIRDRYATLLPSLSTRDDLRDLMGEVIGELGTSHTYVWGGDQGVAVPGVTTGLLGADLSRAGDAFRVDRIYRGDPADRADSPLLAPEARVREGSYILELDHRPVPAGRPFEAALAGLAGKPVVLTVNASASRQGARDVVVTPLADDHPLRYADWVRKNREYVATRTEGKMGYIHLPDMGTSGLVAFNTWFYPQLDREGMVVDVRWNRGGFVSQMILEHLQRRLVSFDRSRAGGVFPYPARTLNGPFVVITNEMAGSDGDIFPYVVQLQKLAPVIGKRSWGGVVGIRADKLMVDGGMLTQPEYAWWDPSRGWGLENHGVDPDIVVDDLPQDVARGVDAQLDTAIETLLKLHAEHPPVEPGFGPAPIKTREAFQSELPQAPAP